MCCSSPGDGQEPETAGSASGTSLGLPMGRGRDDPLLLAVAGSIALSAVISATLSVYLPAILQARGLELAAAVALGALVGPSQVGARAIEMGVSRLHHPIWTKVASVACVLVGVLGLAIDMPVLDLALVFYGEGIGLESVARRTVPPALFGLIAIPS
jgi:hypothetical protein